MHREYGGVVPELASRDHVRHLVGLTRALLAEAGLGTGDLSGVAYTSGPGLIGALLTRGRVRAGPGVRPGPAGRGGAITSRGTCWRRSWSPPRRPRRSWRCWSRAAQPAHGRCRGSANTACWATPWTTRPARRSTKVAKMMGLPYPGGPALAALAEQGRPGTFRFSRPMCDRPGLGFQLLGPQDPRCCWPTAGTSRTSRRGPTSRTRSRKRWPRP
jgi:N6-L-threonylcarbamoyladenine synthase